MECPQRSLGARQETYLHEEVKDLGVNITTARAFFPAAASPGRYRIENTDSCW